MKSGGGWPKSTSAVVSNHLSAACSLIIQVLMRGTRFALFRTVSRSEERPPVGGHMKGKLLALFLLAGSTMFAGPHFGIGIGFGYVAPPPVAVYAPPPAPVYGYVPPSPGYGYTWVGGYWYPAGPRWAWHAGYWARPTYARSYWVAPRYYGGHYYGGYWRRR
jgi:hypothetical protein